MVAPFRHYLHSGSIVHALSAGRPVLTPATPFALSLAAELGRPDWLQTYAGPLDAGDAGERPGRLDALDLAPLAPATAARRLRRFLEPSRPPGRPDRAAMAVRPPRLVPDLPLGRRSSQWKSR